MNTLPLILAALSCSPRASLDGEPEACARLGAELSRRGVAVGSDPDGCPTVAVTLERRDDAWEARLRDGSGVEVVRRARSLEAIAALVEGRARPELARTLFELPPVRPPPPAPEPLERSPPPGLAPPPREAAGPGPALAARGELGRANDGATEPGVALEATAPGPGPLRVGGILRFAGGTVDRDGLSRADRRGGELLAGARRPFAVGPVWVSPGAAVGAALTRVARGGAGGDGPLIRDGAGYADVDLVLETSLLAFVPVGGGLALELTGAASWLPTADTGGRLPDYARGLGGRAAALALPGLPSSRLRAGAGVAWSVP